MKILVPVFVFLVALDLVGQQRTIGGIVFDAETKATISYATVVVLSAKPLATFTDGNGKFKFEMSFGVPNPKLLVSFIGYASDTVDLKDNKNEYSIFLIPNQSQIEEIVVTGVSKATLIRENPVSIVSVSSKTIDRTNESNVIDVLVKNVPGLNAVKTGPNISKPFIRGLGYNRVLTLYDGVRQEGQQWGDEHGIEVDAYNIDQAEVIKGPAGIMYGSDALAGIVSLFPHIPKGRDGVIRGRVLSEYQSNNGLIGNGIRLGASGKHWVWAVRGSNRIARNYTDRVDGRVYNTGFQEKNGSALLGYVSKLGYSQLNITAYDDLQGIPDGSRDSLTRKFTYQVYEGAQDYVKNRPMVSDAVLNSYQLSPLHQHIQHYRAYTNNHYTFGKGDLDAMVGFSQNIRREYDHPTDPNQAGMYVRLNTVNYRVKYAAPTTANIETSFGINGMYQNNKIKDATDFPIPNYDLLEFSPFLFAKWKNERWTVSGGASYDYRHLTTYDLYIKPNPNNGFTFQVPLSDTVGATKQFTGLDQTFKGISFSIGTTYKVTNQISLKANFAKGYRAPNISEIASSGLDPGAHIYYEGNRNFVPEYNFQEDIGIMGEFKDLSASFSIFNNNIQNYIYLTEEVDPQGDPIIRVQGNKTFQYQQSTAQIYGMEAMVNIHPRIIKGFSFNNNFAMTYGFNRKGEFENKGIYGEYLPFIPPAKLLSSLNQEINTKSKIFPSINVKAEIDVNGTQNRYLALYKTETLTPGYTLLNLGMGTDIRLSKKTTVQFQFQVNNLFDAIYQSNLSRLKYFEYYTQSPNGYAGIYGMGRNFCIKLIVPLGENN